ncbi:hypothetical protein DFJ74DRAFT_682785 [Hyaloraphidium curvatum]|nr:hypothetical protein DFJ74DRAFT_682785 [Hyaloraphidium curvatum]
MAAGKESSIPGQPGRGKPLALARSAVRPQTPSPEFPLHDGGAGAACHARAPRRYALDDEVILVCEFRGPAVPGAAEAPAAALAPPRRAGHGVRGVDAGVACFARPPGGFRAQGLGGVGGRRACSGLRGAPAVVAAPAGRRRRSAAPAIGILATGTGQRRPGVAPRPRTHGRHRRRRRDRAPPSAPRPARPAAEPVPHRGQAGAGGPRRRRRVLHLPGLAAVRGRRGQAADGDGPGIVVGLDGVGCEHGPGSEFRRRSRARRRVGSGPVPRFFGLGLRGGGPAGRLPALRPPVPNPRPRHPSPLQHALI